MSDAAVKKEPKAKLITHRELAKLCGVSTRRIRVWVERGQWPEPHSVVEQTWFYRKSQVDHFLEKGQWPTDSKFRRI